MNKFGRLVVRREGSTHALVETLATPINEPSQEQTCGDQTRPVTRPARRRTVSCRPVRGGRAHSKPGGGNGPRYDRRQAGNEGVVAGAPEQRLRNPRSGETGFG